MLFWVVPGISRGDIAEIRAPSMTLAIVGHGLIPVVLREYSSNLECSFMVSVPDPTETGCE